MAMYAQHSGIETVPPSTSVTSLFSSIKSLTERIAAWIETCADYYAAAALYDGFATGQSAAETSASDGKVP